MALWEAVSGSKLERRREALLFNCRREGLFQPVGNVLDKSKLMIYRNIPSHLEVTEHRPQSRMGWPGGDSCPLPGWRPSSTTDSPMVN